MPDVDMTNNTQEVLKLMEKASDAALEIIGGKVEGYAKGLCSPKGAKGNDIPDAEGFRNSITHRVVNGLDNLEPLNNRIPPFAQMGVLFDT